MRLPFLILLVLINLFSFSQSSLTKEQVNRLADAGKVYGYIKYFHPYLQYKNINWDSAFAANVEGIIKAKNKSEYAAVLQKMFSVLNDGLTTVAKIPGDDSNYKVQSMAYQIEDSILYMQMNDAPFMTTDGALAKALQNMNSVKGAIFDLRRPKNSRYMDMLGNGMYIDWFNEWYRGKVVKPSNRTVSYAGFPGEFCKGCNSASFKEDVLFTADGGLNKDVPVVIIVSNDNDVSLFAVKLQEKGVAKILQEGNNILAPGSFLYFYITDSLLIQMRTGEAIDTDGSLLLVNPDETFSQTESFSEVMAKAKKLLINRNHAVSQENIHPLPTDPMFTDSIEPAYPAIGYRMLAAAKMYTIIKHFYASKSSMKINWDSLYIAVIPRFMAAADSLEYWKAAAEFHAGIQDGHGFISKSNEWFSLRLNPIIQDRGRNMPPVFTSLIEDKIIVTDLFNDSVCKKIGLTRGDVVLSIDGKDPRMMIKAARKYQNAGNIGSLNFYLASFILFGSKGEVKKLKIQDAKGNVKQIMMPTLDEFSGNFLADKYVSSMFSYNHQPIMKKLNNDVLYLDVTSGLKKSDIDSVFRVHKKITGVIVDIRGYPQGFVPLFEFLYPDKIYSMPNNSTYKLTANIPASSPYVVSEFRFGSIVPVEQYRIEYISRNKAVKLPFKLVVLTNGSAQSNGDHFPFLYRNMYNATIIGSPTAGAMTNFMNYKIPGNIRLWLSNGPIAREGVQPDIFVTPTIKGIQAGKDEVLERAIKFIQAGK